MTERNGPRLAEVAALLGVCALVLGAVGYTLGWNETGGVRYRSNIVPFSLFVGFTMLCSSGALVLARSPQVLPKCPTKLAMAILSLITWSLVGLYIKQVSALIAVPADIVMGSESQFVDHIIRFRVGQPQYTPAEDANTSPYTPGAPLVTYFIASLMGHATSIPAYRLVQQLFLVFAVLFAVLAGRELYGFCRPDKRFVNGWLWFWIPFLFLIANNRATNPYTHVLYSDALALAVDAFAFWLLVKHFTTAHDRWLISMAIVPSLGFLAKQKGAIWAALYIVYLLLAGRTYWRRVLLFAGVAFGFLALTFGVSYALWGAPFYFWTFEALGRLHVGLAKLLEQVIAGGWYIALGLAGGIVLLRGKASRQLFPLWFCWLLKTLAAIYTSGIAFVPSHLGPATMVGAVWFLLALSTVWPESAGEETGERFTQWLRTIVVQAAVFLFMISAGMLRTGSAVPKDLPRYVAGIEKEFEGLPRETVLLDTGSWVYLSQNVVMKDRESPLGILWGTGTSNFRATIDRIRNHYYQKILVRKRPEGEELFMEAGIRQALKENYREVRIIPSPGVPRDWLYYPLLYDISVLEPHQPAVPLSGTESGTARPTDVGRRAKHTARGPS